MPNEFYTAEQAAQVAVALAGKDAYLSALINRNFLDAVFQGGGKGRTVNVKVPSALIARSRGIDDVTTALVLDELSERTFGITLGEHVYSAVGLSEGDLNLDIEDFSKQVLAPQMDAVVDFIEEEVATALGKIEGVQAGEAALAFDPTKPVKVFTGIRKVMRDRGLPASNLNVVVGTEVYASLLDADAISAADASGSTDALREGNVGRLRGFTIVESNRVEEDEIIAFHRDAVVLATRAPGVPSGASFGAIQSSGGYSLRYLRDYDAMHTQDRSIISTFAGVETAPVYRIERDYEAQTAKVVEVPGGGAIRLGGSAS